MIDFINISKDLVSILFFVLLGSILLYFISAIMVGIFKIIFCDREIKLYRIWSKKLKKHLKNNPEEVFGDDQKKFFK